MKKLLSILGSLTLLSTTALNAVSCDSSKEPEQKLDFNEENVEQFFELNKEFRYEGDFLFFEDHLESANSVFNPSKAIHDIFETLFTKAIINEMSKTIDLDTEGFIQITSGFYLSNLTSVIGEDRKFPLPGQEYTFDFDEVKIFNTETGKEQIFKNLKFMFKQTNNFNAKDLGKKQIDKFLENWFHGINATKAQKFNWVPATNAQFNKKIAQSIENNEIEESIKMIEKGINYFSNPEDIVLGTYNTPFFEEFRFSASITDVKPIAYESSKFAFAEVSGTATFLNLENQKANFSAIWGFYK